MQILRLVLSSCLLCALLPWGAYAAPRLAGQGPIPAVLQAVAEAQPQPQPVQILLTERHCRGMALPGTTCAMPALLPEPLMPPTFFADDPPHPERGRWRGGLVPARPTDPPRPA